MEKLVSLLKKPATWSVVATTVLGLVFEPMHVATLMAAAVSVILVVKESGLLKKLGL
jgi:hypothetical protein